MKIITKIMKITNSYQNLLCFAGLTGPAILIYCISIRKITYREQGGFPANASTSFQFDM